MVRSSLLRRRCGLAACRRCARRVARLLPSATVLPTLLVTPLWAADFELRPTLDVAQYYTDNAALAPAGQERSEWVTQARPGLRFNYNGPQLKFFATAAAEVLFRANSQESSIRPQFNAGTIGSAEIVPQLVYLDANSTVAQRNTSSVFTGGQDRISNTGDQATVTTRRLSPYVRHAAGSEAVSELRYTNTVVDTNGGAANAGSADSMGNRIDARVSSGPAYRLTTWNVAYSADEVDYDAASARDIRTQSFNASAGRLITPFFRVIASAGYRDSNYVSTTASRSSGSTWDLGFHWTPTSRTSLRATTGGWSYGTRQSLDFSHRARRTVWNASYSEEITTYNQLLFAPTEVDTAGYLDTLYLARYPDPVLRQQIVQQFIAQSGLPPTLLVPEEFVTTQVILNKTWRGSVGLLGPQHTFLVNYFSTNREAQSSAAGGTAGDFAQSSTVKQSGAGLVWNWRIATLDSANVSVGYTRSETPATGREDDRTYARASYTRQFGPRTTGTVSYQRHENSSNASGNDYVENRVWANLQMSF